MPAWACGHSLTASCPTRPTPEPPGAAPSSTPRGAACAVSSTVDRLSIAVVDPVVQTFRIVAWDGKGLLAAGTELPLETSTQVGAAARGERYAASDFRSAPGWDRASDRLMLAVGFVSGCSVPLHHPCGDVCGVASLSATQMVDYDSRCSALDARRALARLAALARARAAASAPDTPRARAAAAAGGGPALQADSARALDHRAHGKGLRPRHVPQARRELARRGSLRGPPPGPSLGRRSGEHGGVGAGSPRQGGAVIIAGDRFGTLR